MYTAPFAIGYCQVGGKTTSAGSGSILQALRGLWVNEEEVNELSALKWSTPSGVATGDFFDAMISKTPDAAVPAVSYPISPGRGIVAKIAALSTTIAYKCEIAGGVDRTREMIG